LTVTNPLSEVYTVSAGMLSVQPAVTGIVARNDYVAYSDIVTMVAALLDDQPQAWAKPDYVLPHINSAQRFIVQHLIDNEIPTLRVRSLPITVPAGTLAMSTWSTPALPASLDIPMAIWEAPAGGPASDYRPLPGPFPHDPSLFVRGDTLSSWNWMDGQIQFVGCTEDRDIIIDYVSNLADFINAGTESVAIPAALDAIALIAASSIAITRGQTELASALGTPTPDRLVTGRAGAALSTFINVQKAPEQGPVSRRPYITRYRRPW
jgi:hypothetical protein